MSRLEKPKGNPLDYYLFDDVDIEEFWLIHDKNGCIVKVGMYKLDDLYVMQALLVDYNLCYYKQVSEVPFGEESRLSFVCHATLHFQKEYPELYNRTFPELIGKTMTDLIKVLDGGDFGSRWEGWCIKLEDYENIDCNDYEEQLYNLFEYYSFKFDETEHEYWEID